MSASPPQGYTVNESLVTTVRKLETVIAERFGSIGANAEAFSPALSPTTTVPGLQTIFSILVCFDKSTRISVTFNDGADWCLLNNDDDIVEDNLYLFLFPVKDGDLFNIRFKDSGDIIMLRVGETI